jgi:hypothetical protein
LKHIVQLVGLLAGRKKDTVVSGWYGVCPNAVAYDVSLGYGLQGFVASDIDVSAGNKGME